MCRWQKSLRSSIRSFGAGLRIYGRYSPSALYPLFRYVNMTLLAWVQRKFKRYKGYKVRAAYLLEKLARTRPEPFVHWRLNMRGGFA
jgi:hypothetical protein